MKAIKRVLCAVLTPVLLFGLFACANRAEPDPGDKEAAAIRFVLDWTPNTNHTGLYVALAKHYYKDAELDVQIVQPPEGGAASLVAAGTGGAVFGVDAQDTMAAAFLADPPLPVTAVAAILQHNTSGLLCAQSAGVGSFKALEGKRYATWGLETEQAIIRAVMKTQGGDFSKVKLIPSTVTDVPTALQTDIDAVWVFEGWDTIACKEKGVKASFLSFADAMPVLDYYTPVMIANNRFLEEKPEQARAFLAATARGYQFAAQNPEEAASILSAAAPELDEGLVRASQQFLSGAYFAESEHWGVINPQRWQGFYDWLAAQGLIDQPVEGGFSNDYLPSVPSSFQPAAGTAAS